MNEAQTALMAPGPAPVTVLDGVGIGDGRLALIAGPCLLESPELAFEVAEELQQICARLEVPLVFKASLDKANRMSDSFRSIGFEPALEALAAVKERFGLAVTTDVHETWQVAPVGEVADVIQIPAFLCRQADLLAAAGATGRVVNVKKGQFMAPGDTGNAVRKVRQAGGERVVLTERGSMFGHRDLVVDMRGLATMRKFAPVIFDATHSVQPSGTAGGASATSALELVAPLSRAALAFGVDGLFIETHPAPSEALSDGRNMVPLADMEELLAASLRAHSVGVGAAR